MFRKVLSLLLVTTFLFSTMNFVVPFASYYTNYHYFSTVACINKYKPAMHCNGKCQLKRMLEHEHNDSGQKKAQIDHSVRKDFFLPSNLYHSKKSEPEFFYLDGEK